MKNFFHLTISIILGTLIGYGLYYKILNKRANVNANNIAVDELFFTDNAAFEKQRYEALNITRTKHADTLQVSLQLFETAEQPVNNTALAAGIKQVKPIKIDELKRTIEVAQLPKANTVSIPVNKISTAEIIEVASVHKASSTQEVVTASTTAVENDADNQSQADKKKRFLLFNKKNKND